MLKRTRHNAGDLVVVKIAANGNDWAISEGIKTIIVSHLES